MWVVSLTTPASALNPYYKKRHFKGTEHTDSSSFLDTAPAAAVADPRQGLTHGPAHLLAWVLASKQANQARSLSIFLLWCNKLHSQHGSPKRQGALPSTPEAAARPPSAPTEFWGQTPTLISGTFYKWGHSISHVFYNLVFLLANLTRILALTGLLYVSREWSKSC